MIEAYLEGATGKLTELWGLGTFWKSIICFYLNSIRVQEHSVYDSYYFKFVRFILWPKIWLRLVIIPCAFAKKKKCVFFPGGGGRGMWVCLEGTVLNVN